MARLYLVRHPATQVRPDLPAEEWGLSDAGRAQLEVLMSAPLWGEVHHVFSSPEPKAAIVAERALAERGVPSSLHPELRELGRPPRLVVEYERVVGQVLNHWQEAPEGWEPLASGLDRAWRFLETTVMKARLPVAVVSHGLVLSAVRAKLLGRSSADISEWKCLAFASVATAETEGWTLVEDFAAVEDGDAATIEEGKHERTYPLSQVLSEAQERRAKCEKRATE